MGRFNNVLALACLVMAGTWGGAVAETPDGHFLDRKMPDRWTYASEMEQTLPSEDNWWKTFEDPLLDSLIILGMENNYDVQTAISRMNMCRAQVKGAEAGYYPSIGISAGYTKSRSAGAIEGHDVKSGNMSYFNLGANMQWEIDVFGKVREGVKNKKALYKVSRADYAATMVSLAAEIATFYFNLRVVQRQLDVTKVHLASQKQVVDIAKARFESGLVSKLDVAQAQTVLYSTEATLPQLESTVKQAKNAIATLLGVYPEDIMGALDAPWTTPNYQHMVPVGIPANLLRRRPDILAAEYEVSAYASALGVAKRDFLPTLTINGTIGVASHDAKDMFRNNSLQYSIEPTLTWTVFDGFSRKYAVVEAREQMKAGIENYNQTVLTAVQEVDNAMIAYETSLQAIDSYMKVIEQCKESFKLSVDLYKEGLTSFTNVVDAQINSLTYANSLISVRGDAFISLIDLYKALGGAPTE